MLQTDVNAIGLGAVLEQDGHPVAYASQSLTSSECNYSVIQHECLAIIFALKQFCHYLLGRPFQLYKDHAPLTTMAVSTKNGRHVVPMVFGHTGIRFQDCLL